MRLLTRIRCGNGAEMKTLKVQIAKVGDNYNAMIDGIDYILASGDSISQIKCDILQEIELYKSSSETVPEELSGEFDLEYYLNVQSFLDFYKDIFTKSGLERLSGINQKQLWHYAAGIRKPRKAQCERLENALHKLGEELMSVHF